jgi:hypothetical protein
MTTLPKIPWLKEVIAIVSLLGTGLWAFAVLEGKVCTNEAAIVSMKVSQSVNDQNDQDQAIQIQKIDTSMEFIVSSLQEIKQDLKDLKRASK